MIKVGFTGNYFSGQDQIVKIFKDLDVKIFDADLMLRYFINFSPEHMKKIKTNFGKDSYNLGVLNIDKFKDSEKLEDLLDLLEFDILIAYAKFRLGYLQESYTLFKYSYIYERGIETDFDYIINCSRMKATREMELKEYTRIPTISIKKMLEKEMTEVEKNKLANFVIRNNQPNYLEKNVLKNDDLYYQVEKIHSTLARKIPQDILGD